jgi:hypothetical protein
MTVYALVRAVNTKIASAIEEAVRHSSGLIGEKILEGEVADVRNDDENSDDALDTNLAAS